MLLHLLLALAAADNLSPRVDYCRRVTVDSMIDRHSTVHTYVAYGNHGILELLILVVVILLVPASFPLSNATLFS